MNIQPINPYNKQLLYRINDMYIDSSNNSFPIVKGVTRIANETNYTDNFGIQWNIFDKTQLDDDLKGKNLSRQRLFAETKWDKQDLRGKSVL
jgi:hypothetical protein